MKIVKKFLYSGQINPVTIEDYLNYWRDNNVESDEALIQRLAEKYGADHMERWILRRQLEKNNPYSVLTSTGTVKETPKKSKSTKLADSFEDLVNSNTLEGGLARTVGAATLGAAALTHLPAVIGGTIGGKAVDYMVGDFGKQVEDLTGVDNRIGSFFNPGYIVGGGTGELAWNVGKFLYALRKATKDMPEGFMGLTKGRGNVIKDNKSKFKKKLGKGMEGTVYSDEEGHAYKINENLLSNRNYGDAPTTLLGRIEELNVRNNKELPFLFPTELRGYVFDVQSGKFLPVTRLQELLPYQMLSYHTRLGSYERVKAMREEAAAKGLLLADLRDSNIAVLDDGTFVVVDPIISSLNRSEPVTHEWLPLESFIEGITTKASKLPAQYQHYKKYPSDLPKDLGKEWENLIYNIRDYINKYTQRFK